MDGNIKFRKKNDEMVYNPDKRIDTYYQICQFKNNYTKQFGVRKVFFNELGVIIKIFENEYDGKKIEIFMKNNKPTKFKLYPVNDVSYIDLPTGDDMVGVQSELLNNHCKNYGNADFK